jgi:hypothetical protein
MPTTRTFAVPIGSTMSVNWDEWPSTSLIDQNATGITSPTSTPSAAAASTLTNASAPPRIMRP